MVFTSVADYVSHLHTDSLSTLYLNIVTFNDRRCLITHLFVAICFAA